MDMHATDLVGINDITRVLYRVRIDVRGRTNMILFLLSTPVFLSSTLNQTSDTVFNIEVCQLLILR
jgi:hypothetical protein